MIKPIIDHIEITVKDINKAVSFYDRFLPLLGYDLVNQDKGQALNVALNVNLLTTFETNPRDTPKIHPCD